MRMLFESFNFVSSYVSIHSSLWIPWIRCSALIDGVGRGLFITPATRFYTRCFYLLTNVGGRQFMPTSSSRNTVWWLRKSIWGDDGTWRPPSHEGNYRTELGPADSRPQSKSWRRWLRQRQLIGFRWSNVLPLRWSATVANMMKYLTAKSDVQQEKWQNRLDATFEFRMVPTPSLLYLFWMH